MKKSVILGYADVLEKDIAPISQSADPLNSGRMPVGFRFKTHPKFKWVQPSGTITKQWQAICAIPAGTGDEGYTISPRVFQGLAFVGKKFVQVSERNYPKKALMDLIKDDLTFEVTSYQDVEVDDFDTKELVTRSFPVITMVSATAPVKKGKNA